jgi:tryptophan-rich sensory protein
VKDFFKSNITRLVLCVLLCLSGGFIGSLFTAPAIPVWYAALKKPVFSPPSFLFAPVWTALYIMMGISLYLIIKEGFEKSSVKTAVGIFAVQLFLNFIWSPVFFGLKSPFAALIIIILMWFAIIINIVSFHRIKKQAGVLLIPYLLWVSFATVLNYSVWYLNR